MSGAPIEPPPSSGIAWRKALTVLLAAPFSTFPPVVNWRFRGCVPASAGGALATGGSSPGPVPPDACGLWAGPDEAGSDEGPTSLDDVPPPPSLEGDGGLLPPEEPSPPSLLALPPLPWLVLPGAPLAVLAGPALVRGAERAEFPPTFAGLKNPRAPAIRMSLREPPPAAEVFIAVVAARYWLTD